MKSSFVGSLAISVFLLVAAVAKWLYPVHLAFRLDRIASIIEIAIAITLPIVYRKAWAWAWISSLFSLWLGYGVFWWIQNKNCGCFGQAFQVSAGLTVVINAIVIGMAFWNWGRIEKQAKKKQLFIVIDGLLLVTGFLTATWINWMTEGVVVG
ncbi:MAG: hypothetical protein KGZ30_03990 [Anaplasmataceae bacterium]|nr:hypothetical protein [Anaplasmataceae bacterium]